MWDVTAEVDDDDVLTIVDIGSCGDRERYWRRWSYGVGQCTAATCASDQLESWLYVLNVFFISS